MGDEQRAENGAVGQFTCPSQCVEQNHPGREHEQWTADAEADRWDEGWIAAVGALTPFPAGDERRLLYVLRHMPEDNPYRTVLPGDPS